MKNTYYTIYLNSTDEIVAAGDSEECQKQLNRKTLMSFYSLVSKNRLGVQKKYTIITDTWNENDDITNIAEIEDGARQ